MASEVPADVNLHSPTKYTNTSSASTTSPPVEWLHRTWSVTHSTLSMWRDARNVRITYKPLDPKPNGAPRIDDLVEYEPSSGWGEGKLKSVEGVDTAADANSTTAWDWKGKGLLFWVHSHWEVLGWGERPLGDGGKDGVERWAVTWFAPTTFTNEGVDVYCDRREGLSEETYALVLEALKKLEAKKVAAMVEKDMQPVEIKLPWKEK